VTEIVVRHIRRSVDFYERLGFTLLCDGGDFVELTWEDHRLCFPRWNRAGGSARPALAPRRPATKALSVVVSEDVKEAAVDHSLELLAELG